MQARRVNCLVVVLDAAAAAHMGMYGAVRDTTPQLDAFAREGVVFERAYSQAASTAISAPSYLTGLYPRTIRRRLSEGGEPPRTIAEVFQAAGFRTGAFVRNVYVGPDLKLDRGYDRFELSPAATSTPEGHALSAQTIVDAIEWAGAVEDEPFFAYVHLMRPHHPYDPPESFVRHFTEPTPSLLSVGDHETYRRLGQEPESVNPIEVERLKAYYDANLRFADALVGALLGQLDRLGALDDTLVVVTSDHGEAFGQHGQFMHNTTLYDEMIRVPLIVRFPSGIAADAGRVPAPPVGLVDLFPTLVEAFGLRAHAPDPAEGRSLLPLLEGAEGAWSPRLLFSQVGTAVGVLDHAGHKLILTDTSAEPSERLELYALASDPAEENDLSTSRPHVAAALAAAARDYLGGRLAKHSVPLGLLPVPTHDQLDEDVRERLRALGYL